MKTKLKPVKRAARRSDANYVKQQLEDFVASVVKVRHRENTDGYDWHVTVTDVANTVCITEEFRGQDYAAALAGNLRSRLTSDLRKLMKRLQARTRQA